ncbi:MULTISPECIES: histidine phosphatase family protein [Exiguobacterium]|nr:MULTISPECIES: histidine phosphatase family protein [Exiguobacterium]MCT4781141.1 histidine phosphatase family protein [Exiguobacterium soli]
MTTIYLVRHAHSTYSAEEETRPLSERGMVDAKQLLSLFREIKIDDIYASPYQRAIETVQPLAEQRELTVHEAADFRERVLAPGRLDDFRHAVQFVWEHPTENPYGGESNEEAKQRIVQGIRQILTKHENETVVIGTHGNIMVLLMQFFDPAYDYDFWKTLKMPAVYRMVFKNGECHQIKEIAQRSY